MTRSCILFFLFAALAICGCKKEKPHDGKPDDPKEIFPEWVMYNKANSKLPDDQINAMAITGNDVKWIGTANGLARIKDNSWTVYNTGNSALPSSFITALAVEDNGTVWVGTDQGLVRFDGTAWAVYTTGNSILTNNGIKCITYDAAHKITWIGTEEGIVKIDSEKHWEYIYTSWVILSMVTDQNGALWVGAFNDFAFRGMIRKYENGKWTVHQLHDMGYTSALPYALAVDKNNAVLAALAGTVVKAVIRFNGNGWEEVPRPEKASGLRTMVLEGDKVWVGGNNLSVFGDKGSPSLTIPGTNSPILSMALDSRSRKWLGTIYGGLAVYNPAGK